ncbi:hypothetical protein [Orenia marismortui]|uniref:hypothetical protein n=1 Tax=Orenia marismortui TaxID=46469 RepID=UPI00036293FA|nr:hypothetical protein [Orenia marismortui]
MYACPILFIANKSLIKKQRNSDDIICASSCQKECIWFDNKKEGCIMLKNPNKSYIKKTLGCI